MGLTADHFMDAMSDLPTADDPEASSLNNHTSDVFPIFSLPTEIRLQIFRFALPYAQVIEFSQRTLQRHPGRPGFYLAPLPENISNAINLIGTCRQFEVEAKGILYGENVFRFVFTREHVASRGSTFELMPTEAVRQVRKCELVIGDSLYEEEVYRRIQKWMRFVACRLAGVHRLLELHIDLRTGEFEKTRWSEYFKPWADGQVARIYQYCLEPLAFLTRVGKVRITGHVDEGFAKALTEVMMKGPKEATLVGRSHSSGSRIGSDNVTRSSVINPVTADKRRFFDPDWIW
ncbi:uncharacterized protein K441DRAFT_664944 [Cenococcum geophilum 1.58]|uniref:uncharacterized protein n=1 Tax=Cenococcum geophilum 1.58 TaxID=794803 RepID=UPI00358E0284|nr:hypothetical protein K441DRAFT_664944 [Cenococcum geophilum 1.58]